MAQEVEKASGGRGRGSGHDRGSGWGRVENALRRRRWGGGEGASTYLGSPLGAGKQPRRFGTQVQIVFAA